MNKPQGRTIVREWFDAGKFEFESDGRIYVDARGITDCAKHLKDRGVYAKATAMIDIESAVLNEARRLWDEGLRPMGALSAAIVNISDGFDALLRSGLNRRAVVALLYDRTKVRKTDIERVLDGLTELKKWYTASVEQKATKKERS